MDLRRSLVALVVLWTVGASAAEFHSFFDGTALQDQEEGHFDLKGILGLQLRAGEPMTVQFEDIQFRELP